LAILIIIFDEWTACKGNWMTLTCPFHGWTFRNDGTLLKVEDPEGAGCPDTFHIDGSHNMSTVAPFDGYRGSCSAA
jgi:benzoate/toluate 1,2-dioxygenase subunit alpha